MCGDGGSVNVHANLAGQEAADKIGEAATFEPGAGAACGEQVGADADSSGAREVHI